MSDPLQRRLVERLLSGDHRVSDLSSLFLYLRDRCDGREPVQEVGHFIAHQNERTHGFATRSAKDVYSILKFKYINLGKHVNFFRLDIEFPNFLRATVYKMAPQDFGKGPLSRRRLGKLIDSIISKSRFIYEKYYTIYDNYGNILLNPDELSALNHVMPMLIVKEAFTGVRLFSDFRESLRTNGLLLSGEFRKFEILSSLVQLYALTVMHRSSILLQNGDKGTTFVCLNEARELGKLTLSLKVDVDLDEGRVSIVSPLCATDLLSVDYCEDDVLNAGDQSFVVFDKLKPFTSPTKNCPTLESLFLDISTQGKLCLF